MKSKLIILGSGSSVGVPRIDGYWGNCKKSKKNHRTRCSALIQKGRNNILIDTSPDLRSQLLVNRIKNISSVLYTHQHADQTHGINDLRTFYIEVDKDQIESEDILTNSGFVLTAIPSNNQIWRRPR